ncbi:MAG: AbrB/MazE/SpoVT family DNA-binding domain-containing protein [Candidatus Omnitrophica bacterium]|nr:AbrB/MazE/SpoVT family DNA-binding domain-containing protein [Candidatus Omnitrophota bacterium]
MIKPAKKAYLPETLDEIKSVIIHVSSKGQITLPKIIREKLHIKEGDMLRLKKQDSEIIIRRIEVMAEEEFNEKEWEKLKKLAQTKGKTFSKAEDFLKKLERM